MSFSSPPAVPLSLITLSPYSNFTSSRKPSIVNPIHSHLLHLHPRLHPANPNLDLLECCFRGRILGRSPQQHCKFIQDILPTQTPFPPSQEGGQQGIC